MIEEINRGKKQKFIAPLIPFQHQANNRTINYIHVLDQMPNGKGGYATLLRGGVGFNNTGLHLKSQRGEGLNFMIDIYGV